MSGPHDDIELDGAAFNPCLVEHDAVDRDIYDHLRRVVREIRILEVERHRYSLIPQFLFECFTLFFKAEPCLVPASQVQGDDHFRLGLLTALIETPSFYRNTARTTLDEFGSIVMSLRITRALLRVLDDLGGATGGGVSRALVGALEEAFARAMAGVTEELTDLRQWATGWGTHEGELRRLPIAEKLALMEKLQGVRALRQLSQLAGNAVGIAQRKRISRVQRDQTEIVGVQVGGPFERMLPSELALLARPRLRRLLLTRIAEQTYATQHLYARESLGRGPLIVCIDTSGSMQIAQRETWSKAVALSLYTQARQDRRTFAYIQFSSYSELRTVVIRKYDSGLDQLIDIATFAFCGGTDFNRPLREAMALIRGEPGLRRADIVFITDGECGVSPHVLTEIRGAKVELGFSIWGVLITETGFQSTWWVEMEQFCDRVYPIQELTADAIGEIVDPLL